MGHYARRGPPLPVRAGRGLHALRRLPLLDPGRHQPQPPVPVHRHQRPAGDRRRAGDQQLPRQLAAEGRPGRGATPGPTYAERLQAAGVTWRVYQDMADNFSDNSLAASAVPRRAEGRARRRSRRWRATGLSHAALDALKADVLAGSLPQVSWIVAPAEGLRAPRPLQPGAGRRLHRPRAGGADRQPGGLGEDRAPRSMFDENDGFFDHVPPPRPAVAGRRGAAGRRLDRRPRRRTPPASGRQRGARPSAPT